MVKQRFQLTIHHLRWSSWKKWIESSCLLNIKLEICLKREIEEWMIMITTNIWLLWLIIAPNSALDMNRQRSSLKKSMNRIYPSKPITWSLLMHLLTILFTQWQNLSVKRNQIMKIPLSKDLKKLSSKELILSDLQSF